MQATVATTALPLVHIRTAGAAGKLNIGFWDHWVPGGTEKMRQQVEAWAEENKVDVTADFITSQGQKLLLTAAAEAQAQAGHDVLPFFQWDAFNYGGSLEPVDDVVQSLTAKYGAYDPVVEYLVKPKDHWLAVPGTDPTANLTCCGRISMLKKFAGIDVQAMYPAEPKAAPEAAGWTYDAFLKGAEACAKAGFPFGMGVGATGNSYNTVGAIFRAFGAELVSARGDISVDSDNVRAVLEYGQKLVKFFPKDTGQLRRCLKQPRADLRQQRPDLESAIRMGGSETRRPGGRQGLLDVPMSGRPERALHPLCLHVLRHLDMEQEQIPSEGIARTLDATKADRGTSRRLRRF